MNTNPIKLRNAYNSPRIERITLDNEISLALESISPPVYPNETITHTPEYFNNDPFKPTFG